jgi:teichuronic acid biosynthesis glycosyltransferase TuaH
MSSAAVGLTPYTDSSFNRASFPLKTLEYLASGLPVVATDNPAARWLDTTLVDVAESAASFAELVQRRLEDPRDHERSARRSLAARHTWDVRARALLDTLAQASGTEGRLDLAPTTSGDSPSTWR